MTQGPIDRRVSRTRDALKRGLLALMREADYDTITVEQICQAANVGRSTFYLHFASKDDLKQRSMEEHLRSLLTAGDEAKTDASSDPRLAFALPILRHALAHHGLHKAGGGSSSTTSLRIIRAMVMDKLRKRDFQKGPNAKTAEQEFSAQFLAGGFMAILTWWLDTGARLAPEEIDRRFRKVVASSSGASNG